MFLFNTKKKINTLALKTRVLVSPLDWGLGHATRCIPLISALLSNNCKVFIAAEEATFDLLKNEFPQLIFLPLAGYRVKFSRNKSLLSLKIVSQFPKIMRAIFYERKWLKKIIRQYKINAVISDNRVGLYNKNILSVYITHQLSIKTGNIFTAAIAQRIHRYWINKFDECWVPDFEKNSLAGELSHPSLIPKNVQYIGALSRFEKKNNVKKKYDLLIILSGPEPQRSIFEKLLLNDLLSYNGEALLIRGLPGSTGVIESKKKSIEIVNHLSAEALCKAIQQAVIIISRSGYTSIMDLVKLAKKAILIPTPGQTEQEYLGRYLMGKGFFFTIEQRYFDLSRALENFSRFRSSTPVFDMEQYKAVIKRFVKPE